MHDPDPTLLWSQSAIAQRAALAETVRELKHAVDPQTLRPMAGPLAAGAAAAGIGGLLAALLPLTRTEVDLASRLNGD